MRLRSVMLMLVMGILLLNLRATRANSSPSFDCSRAKTTIENSICGSDKLASADTDLATLFAKVRDRFDAQRRTSLLAGQRAWLKLREIACPFDIAATEFERCLQRLYDRRVQELNRQAALQDEEAAEPKAPPADIDAVLDAKRDLAAYSEVNMSAMRRLSDEKIVDERVPQSCRELNILSAGQVWEYSTDNIGMNSESVAETKCEYALQSAVKWPSPAPTGHDTRFDDITKYSWEWANLTGQGDYNSSTIGSFAKELETGKIKLGKSCGEFDSESDVLFIEAGKAESFCFGCWTYLVNNRVFGDFSHHGREEALMEMTMLPSDGTGTYRVHGLWIAYYDAVTDSIRPECLMSFYAASDLPTASGGAATAIAPDIRGPSPLSPR